MKKIVGKNSVKDYEAAGYVVAKDQKDVPENYVAMVKEKIKAKEGENETEKQPA